MKSRWFLENFGPIATAPNGVSKLREMILSLALQGKLVKQSSMEIPASELLKEIKAEKQRLVKEKTIRTPRPLLGIGAEEARYALPTGWEWVRFGEVAQHNSGKTLDKRCNTGLPHDYITTSNLYWGHFDLVNVRQMLIRPKFQRASSELPINIRRIRQESVLATGYMYPCVGRFCPKLHL